MAVLDEACLDVEPARGLVLGDDGELNLLNVTGHVRHGSIDEAFADAVLAGFISHIHAPDHGLVALLGVGMHAQADDADQPLREDCAEDLRLRELIERIDRQGVTELVIATNPTMQGEATALFLADMVRDRVRVTRLASGLPVGADLEHADELTLGRALLGRREI